MIKVGILFGGKSAEHEISLLSAKNVYDAIDRTKFEPVLIGIDKTGRWLLNDAKRFLLNAGDAAHIKLNPDGKNVVLHPDSGGMISAENTGNISIDVVFPILHGPFGEDGTIQGLLKLADIPFVGPGVLGSAAGMDKDVMKRLLRDAGIPIGKFLALKSHEKMPSFKEIEAAFSCGGVPFFIKPANMGSSVGISKVHNEAELSAALKDAFLYDTKVIIEEYIPGREIECAVLGNEEPLASLPGEIIPSHEFYSYDAKYLDEKGAAFVIPAKLNEEATKRIQDLAVKVFKTLCCEGLSRVDFFLKENSGDIIVNEINTMPGFTRISMYPKMWEASGVSYTDLITRLIELAMRRFEKERKLKTSVV
ncbi:MAG: D-alanine--D-alanine ligase [Treponema sp.]|jgi:D-alanine-D-alanine ligase|nr:D-alanine--D-alanine ligase [Treponema sp.]